MADTQKNEHQNQISFGQSVNMAQAINLVATLGHEVTYLFSGEPGVGKSSMLKELAKMFPDHETAYIDRFGKEPPLPYPIAILGHAHKIERKIA